MSNSQKTLEKIRHSLAHLLAMAVLEKKPEARQGIGPVIENGFYYDFDLDKITPEDLPEIEKTMKGLIRQNLIFKKRTVTFAEAKKIFSHNPYKLELINELKKEAQPITIYETRQRSEKQPLFVDLCAGPHVKSTAEINPDAFHLTKIAGAYWRGDEKNKMLQRIYGVAFKTAKELRDFIEQQKEAEARDHRKLGAELDLFLISDEVGQGLPLFLPAGARLRHEIMMFALNTYLAHGYELVNTPHIGRAKLWQQSGHLKFYKENMYAPFGIEGENYLLKPMNCPMHIQLYKYKIRSYRDLPIRFTEMGTVYRYEKSGTLHGLTRVRGFTQDDAHIICTPEQIEDEIKKALKLTLYILKTFGFKDFEMNLSVRDPKQKTNFIGSDAKWRMAEQSLKKALRDLGFTKFVYDIGGAVFYGPKIDVKVRDALGRQWQLSTIQFDFNLPERFGLFYIDQKGKPAEPFMIHRALLGSLERFIGVYIEHTGGAFPLWVAPYQVAIIPVSEKFQRYAKQVQEALNQNQVRTISLGAAETLSKRIRQAEKTKIPYIVVVGQNEEKNKTVSLRQRGKGDIGVHKLDNFIERLKKEIKAKK